MIFAVQIGSALFAQEIQSKHSLQNSTDKARAEI